MVRFSPEQRSWPSPRQEWLLRACLLRGPAAIDSWRQWRVHTVFDRLDLHSQRLMPLLYRNLSEQGLRDPLLETYKGFYRRTWYVNQLNRRPLAEVLRRLHADGVPLLLLKGVVLLDHYYRDPGLRPMDDLDVLVPTAQAESVFAQLAAWGWIRIFEEDWAHSRDFRNHTGQSIDVHRYALHSCPHPGADDDFWSGAVPAEFAGVPLLVLQKADLLLNVCEHGMLKSWGPGWLPEIRWVADAATVLRQDWSPADSERLLEQVEKRQLFLAVRAALAYLERLLEEPLPVRLRAAFNLPGAPSWNAVVPSPAPPGTTADHVLRLWFHRVAPRQAELVFLNRGPWPGLFDEQEAPPDGAYPVEDCWLVTNRVPG